MPTGAPTKVTMTVSTSESSSRAAEMVSSEPITGSRSPMCSEILSVSFASPRKSLDGEGAFVDGAQHLAHDHRRFLGQDRDVGDAVLVHDVDDVADGFVRVDVHQVREFAGLGLEHLAHGGFLAAGQEAVGAHPLVVEDLGQVAAAGIGQDDHHHGVLGQVLGDPQGGDHGHAG